MVMATAAATAHRFHQFNRPQIATAFDSGDERGNNPERYTEKSSGSPDHARRHTKCALS